MRGRNIAELVILSSQMDVHRVTVTLEDELTRRRAGAEQSHDITALTSALGEHSLLVGARQLSNRSTSSRQ